MYKGEKRKAYGRKWYAKNREKERLRGREKGKRLNRADPRRRLVVAARSRAKLKGLAFDLQIDDIVIPVACPVLGLILTVSDATPSANSPTIDRIDNSLGYIRGNVRVISYRANTLKNDATLEEIEAIRKYMLDNQF